MQVFLYLNGEISLKFYLNKGILRQDDEISININNLIKERI